VSQKSTSLGQDKKTFNKPQSPFDRVTASSETQEEIKERLKSMKKHISLMSEMKKMQIALDKLTSMVEPVPSSFINQR
jgi:guanylate kinase